MPTITKVHDDHARARDAVTAWEAAAFRPRKLVCSPTSQSAKNMAMSEHRQHHGCGARCGRRGQRRLLAGLGLLASPGVGPIVAAGWLAATAAGRARGRRGWRDRGGLSQLRRSRTSRPYSEAIRRGGTLVSVKVDDAQAGRVAAILDSHQPLDPDRLGADYRKTGWEKFDPAAAPYDISKIEREGMRR